MRPLEDVACRDGRDFAHKLRERRRKSALTVLTAFYRGRPTESPDDHTEGKEVTYPQAPTVQPEGWRAYSPGIGPGMIIPATEWKT